MNRGSPSLPFRPQAARPSFNEAPIHESGKCRTTTRLWPESSGFNEAPIHESGKSTPSDPQEAYQRRFNEAPIHESGKSGAATGSL